MFCNWYSIKESIFLICSLLTLVSCFKKNEQQREEVSSIKPNKRETTVLPVPNSIATKPASVRVNVYLEISNGMKGFMPPATAGSSPTEFQSRVVNIISEVEDGSLVANKGYYLAKEDMAGNPILDSVSYEKIKSTLIGGNKEDIRGTPLPSLLHSALQKSINQGAVSIIISDFIHGPNESNKNTIFTLDSEIRSSLKIAEQKGLSVAILADVSSFYGSYHPAVKQPAVKRKLNGEVIPYYIWVIGRPSDVQVVTQRVLENLPAQQAYFGFINRNTPYSAILKNNIYMPEGIVYCNSTNPSAACTSISLLPGEQAPVEFVVGMDLKSLPKAMQDLNSF
jgi:hypothetical protein